MSLKRIIAAFVLLCMVACMLPPMQTNAATEDDYTYEVVDGQATITGYTGPGGDIAIPSTLGGYPVTGIGNGAFQNNKRLTSVTIPDGVASIGASAFDGCTGLISVMIGNGVTKIGEVAFRNCSSLTSVRIPDSVTKIYDMVFSNCTSLVSLEIGDGLTRMGGWMFEYCSRLTSVKLGKNMTEISGGMFYSCTSLSSVTIPDSVTTIGIEAFHNCKNLTSVVYCGTAEQWSSISIAGYNTSLNNAMRQYHDYQDATCTTPKTCILCSATMGDALDHNGTWLQLIAPTCTDGLEACICDTCGITVTRPIPATHNYKTVVVAPTCTGQGYTTNTCINCGQKIVTDETATTGHSYTAVVTAPTCTTDGYTTYTCSVCADRYVGDYVEASHSYESVVTAPTCTEQGYTTHTCSACGDSYVDSYVDATGHTWSDWIPLSAPTCVAEGSQLRFCNCGTQETETLEKLPHSYADGICTACGHAEKHDHVWENGACTSCGQSLAEAMDLSGDGKITAFDAQILAEAKAGLRTLTEEQWQALGDLTTRDIVDYVLGRFPEMSTEE